ncbi:MAG: DinB family protein [Thermoguttaceae bacterium]|jgi:hypothetical protein|nr:DinB family protein [Thermoguttaceae bacterium]
MDAKDVLRQLVESCHLVVRSYVEDLTDADLLVRSVPGTNHIAWQLGHLAASTSQMLSMLGHDAGALPPGFAEAHSAQSAASDDPARFSSKAEYLSLADQSRAATLAAIEATPEAELDAPGPEPFREIAPSVASMLALAGTHWLMHAGQFVPIRRKLGKPPLF